MYLGSPRSSLAQGSFLGGAYPLKRRMPTEYPSIDRLFSQLIKCIDLCLFLCCGDAHDFIIYIFLNAQPRLPRVLNRMPKIKSEMRYMQAEDLLYMRGETCQIGSKWLAGDAMELSDVSHRDTCADDEREE